MKKLLILTIFFQLILSSHLYCFKKDVNYYEKLLSNIQTKNPKNNSEINLQKSLAYKIINLLKNNAVEKQVFTVGNIVSPKKFVEKFSNLTNIYSSYLKNKDLIKENIQKMDILKSEISTIDNKTEKFLSYQLQYDFYHFLIIVLKRRNALIEQNYEKWLKALLHELRLIKFGKNPKLKEKIDDLSKILSKNKLKMEEFKIEKERLIILGKKTLTIDKSISFYEKKNFDILKSILRLHLLSFFKNLKYSLNSTFTVKSDTEEFLQNYFISDKYFLNAMTYSLDKITELKFGKKNVLIHNTKKTIKDSFFYVISLLKKPLFTINNKGISSIDVMLAIIIFIIGVYIGLFYKKYINRISSKAVNLTDSTKVLISNIGYYLIIVISFFITLKILGLDLSSLTLIAGALSVGIGFGLQSIISNFICGLILMFEKSIKIGDFIEISQELIGTVLSINMRATIIKTNDNIEIIIPNQTLFQNNVINWTLSDEIRRLRIPFGVAYGSDVEKVKSVVLAELFSSDLEFIRKDNEKKPNIIMTAMDNSSVNFDLVVWVSGYKTKFPINTKSEFLILIYNALYKHHIEIPFPQMDIHLKDFKDVLKIKNLHFVKNTNSV